MDTEPVIIEKSYFFRPGVNVYIHRSDECKEYVGVLHKHKFIEMVYILSGQARHIIDGQEYIVEKGDVSVINADEAHVFLADESCADPFLAYDLMFTPDFLDSTVLAGDDFAFLADSFLFHSLFSDEKSSKARFNLVPGCNYEIGTVFEEIYTEYKEQKNGCINLIRLYIAEILIKLLRKIQAGERGGLSSAQKRLVAQMMTYIENNYSIKIKTDMLAAKLFLNKKYIAKLFKQETGLSIHDFVREIRLQEVCRLLSSTERTIGDIAAACGFDDMKTFYAVFKKYKGCTPKEYRDRT